ncbi:hypothetical protein Ddc_17984 [Ditylenchus destructor]|nr:hypothetical protein Ddc_17984 [Ditylenchus destructor]
MGDLGVLASVRVDVDISNLHQSEIKMFDEDLSPEEYNKLIALNAYSKQVPLEVDGKETIRHGRSFYKLRADVYQDSNHCQGIATTVLYAHVELIDEHWPLFQHFVRLLVDPFIYIRTISLCPQKDVLSLLAGAMNPDRDRLQCKKLNIRFNGDTQKFIVWVKDHMRCDECEILVDTASNFDEELLDLFLTGAPCTSAINVRNYDLSKVIVDLVQKFMGLKNRDDYQVIESTRGYGKVQSVLEEFKRNFAEFVADEEQYEEGNDTRQVVGFVNNDIKKKLTLSVKKFSYGPSPLLIVITDL